MGLYTRWSLTRRRGRLRGARARASRLVGRELAPQALGLHLAPPPLQRRLVLQLRRLPARATGARTLTACVLSYTDTSRYSGIGRQGLAV